MSLLKADPDALPPIPAELIEPTNAAERKRLLDEAEASIRAGHGTPNSKVRAWLLELAAGRYASPPCGR